MVNMPQNRSLFDDGVISQQCCIPRQKTRPRPKDNDSGLRELVLCSELHADKTIWQDHDRKATTFVLENKSIMLLLLHFLSVRTSGWSGLYHGPDREPRLGGSSKP